MLSFIMFLLSYFVPLDYLFELHNFAFKCTFVKCELMHKLPQFFDLECLLLVRFCQTLHLMLQFWDSYGG